MVGWENNAQAPLRGAWQDYSQESTISLARILAYCVVVHQFKLRQVRVRREQLALLALEALDCSGKLLVILLHPIKFLFHFVDFHRVINIAIIKGYDSRLQLFEFRRIGLLLLEQFAFQFVYLPGQELYSLGGPVDVYGRVFNIQLFHVLNLLSEGDVIGL